MSAFTDVGDERQVFRVGEAKAVENFMMKDVDAVFATKLD